MFKNFKHEKIETNVGLLLVLTMLAVSAGGLVEIAPLFFIKDTMEKVDGVRPYTPLEQRGRDIYLREGCYTCHSQMIRPFRDEQLRYGHYSLAAESRYDHPFQWGSKRTGPDLARVGGKYSDDWQRVHLLDPREVVPESNMPSYRWLALSLVDGQDVQARMRVLRKLGDPYTDEDIKSAPKAVAGRTELDALVAYLQGLGVDNVPKPAAPASAASGAGGKS